ncbi:type IV secretory pathway VirB10-like protein [Staphylococcus borealis]
MQKTRIIKYFINRKGVIHIKKLFGVLLTSTLILGACSTHNDASKKDEDTKSGMKSNDPNKDKSKDNKKDNDKKKSENKSKKDDKNANEKENPQDKSSSNEQPTQQTQTNQDPQSQQTQEQQANNNQQSSGLLNQEQMEANARVAKENGYTGIPNGDIGAADEMEAYAKQRYEEDKNINNEDVEEFTPEEEQAAMERHANELEQEGLK